MNDIFNFEDLWANWDEPFRPILLTIAPPAAASARPASAMPPP